jgi:6-phosphogluconolactonase (cycloisomerase 2 family)
MRVKKEKFKRKKISLRKENKILKKKNSAKKSSLIKKRRVFADGKPKLKPKKIKLKKEKKLELPIFFSILGWQLILKQIRKNPLWPFQKYWQEAVVVLLFLSLTSSTFFLFNSPRALGATHYWVQSDWSGGLEQVEFPIHPANKTNWSKYYEKDEDVVVSSGLALSSTASSTIQTTEEDFIIGTYSNTTSTDANLKLEAGAIGIGEKLTNPSPAIPSTVRNIAFSSDDKFLAVACYSSPYLIVYNFDPVTGTIGAKLDNPAVLPSSLGLDIAFSSDDKFLAISHHGSPYITVYNFDPVTGTIGAKLDNPAVLPPGAAWSVAFSSDDKFLSVGYQGTSPYFIVYNFDPVTGTIGAKLDNPAVSASGYITGMSFSSDDKFLAINGYITGLIVYNFDSIAGEIGAVSASLGGQGNNLDFSSDDKFLAIAYNSSPYILVYNFDPVTGTIGAKLDNPAVLPSGVASSVAFSSDDNLLAISHYGSPYILVYNFDPVTGTIGAKLDNPAVLPPNNGMDVAFSSDDKFLSVGNFNSSPNLTVYNLTNIFYSSGDFTSSAIDTGQNSDFTTLDFTADVPDDTILKFQMKSADTEENLSIADWYGPTGTDDYYTISGQTINSIHDGDRWIQYKAYFETEDPFATPMLSDITINYAHSYALSGSLTSSPYDTFVSTNALVGLSWIESVPSASTTIKFQLRTSPDNLIWTDWWGPTATGTDYFTNSAVGCSKVGSDVSCTTIPNQISDISNDQWIQYKLWLETENNALAPTVSSVSLIYIVNDVPNFESAPTSLQITDDQDIDWGKVEIDYSIRDTDTEDGSVTAGYVTPSFEYSLDNGENWSDITSEYLLAGDLSNKAVEEESYTQYSALWDAQSQVQVFSTTTLIRVTIDDNELANGIASSTTAAFTLDTINPDITTPTIDASKNQPEISFVCTDDSSPLEMKVGLSPDLSDASWTSYLSTSTVSLSEAATIYAQCRDGLGNISAISSVIVPDSPENLFWQDISNIERDIWRVFIAWGVVAEPNPGFAKYNIYRSTDGSDFVLYDTIEDRQLNYILESDLSQIIQYSWKFNVEDDAGNISFYSETVTHTPDGVGGTDITPPTLTAVQSSEVTPSTAKISWATNKLANSTVYYKEINTWPGSETSSYDQSVGVSAMVSEHEVFLTNLTPNTQYFFLVQSTDVSENIGQSALEVYTFTTDSGPVISNVSVISIYDEEATIAWNTDAAADSSIVYSINADLSDSLTKTVSDLVTSRSVTIDNLNSGTTYWFYVCSTDESSNIAQDKNINEGVIEYYSFNTTLDTTDPEISLTETSLLAHDGATITWQTDEPTTSKVIWGTSQVLDQETATTSFYTTKHTVSLTELSSKTKYYYQVVSADKSGNITIDDNNEEQYYFTTPDPETVFVAYTSIRDSRDTSIPVISSLRVLDITDTSAVVKWVSNKASDSFVKYGLAKNAFTYTAGTPGENTTHEISLTNLTPFTTYYIQATGRDIYGILGQSDIISFITLAEGEEPEEATESEEETAEPITQERQAIELIQKGSLTFIESILQAIPQNPYFADISEEAFVSSVFEMAPRVVIAPIISGNEIIVETAPRSALISWTTNKSANSLVAFVIDSEYDSDKEDPYFHEVGDSQIQTTFHQVALTGLEPGTTYHYQVRSQSSLGPVAKIDGGIFTTPSLSAEIADVKFEELSESEAVLSWKTSLPTKTIIDITNNITGETLNKEDLSFLIDHQFKVVELEPGTSYTLQVKAQDEAGNISLSSLFPFSTQLSLNPPAIFQTRVTASLVPGTPERVQTIFTWQTDKPATSRVLYQEGAIIESEPSKSTLLSDVLVMSHMVIITGMNPGSVYTFQVESVDALGNISLSKIHTILTPQPSENIIDLIFNSFQETFRFLKK